MASEYKMMKFYKVTATLQDIGPEFMGFKRTCNKIKKNMEITFQKDQGSHYGNGYVMFVQFYEKAGVKGQSEAFDIRYDKDFRIETAISYICAWANRKWSGEQGSWTLISINIR